MHDRAVAATAHPLATEAACKALLAGGNAVDAAVAAAWTLAVCEPGNSGLGGQTIMLVHLAGSEANTAAGPRVIVNDGHSRAPSGVSLATVNAGQQRTGFRATTLPTTPLVLEAARQRYGRLPLSAVMEYAIHLAEDGFLVTRLHQRQLGWCRASLAASPSASELFLNNGRTIKEGERFRQLRLAATLTRIARAGVADFYEGQVARRIASDMQKKGGLITLDDLAAMRPPCELPPLTSRYRGNLVFTTPSPSGGPLVLEGLKLLERADFTGDPRGHWTGNWYETLGEVTHAVFSQRERQAMESAEPAVATSAVRAPDFPDVEEPGETTHLCTADGEGNIVSLTQSIQSLFGARVACGPCGFLYNNYLLTCPRVPHAHQLAAGCVPRSNAAPTLIVSTDGPLAKDSAPRVSRWIALGGAGSRRITSAILHAISGIVDREMPLDAAIDMPRLHVKLSRRAWLERSSRTEALLPRLAERFRSVRFRSRHSYAMGCVQAIQVDADTMRGTADPRREGTARVLDLPTKGE